MGQHYTETDILSFFFFLPEPSLFLECLKMLCGFPGRGRSHKCRAHCPWVQNYMVCILNWCCNASILGQVLHREGDCPFIASDDKSPSHGPSSCNNKKYTIGINLQSINSAPLPLQSQSTTCLPLRLLLGTYQAVGRGKSGNRTVARSSAKQNFF